MKMGKLNVFYIDSEEKRVSNPAFFTDATEEEFKELLDNYLSENKFNDGLFAVYVAKNGYHIMTSGPKRKVLSPSI